MRTIYKYPIEVVDEQIVKMPQFSKILTVQLQRNHVCIWAEVETDEPIVDYELFIFGTGHEIPPYLKKRYIGTFQLLGGDLVFHLYEKLKT
jgi:hypothetical protein